MTDLSHSERNPVEALAEEFLARRRRGETPSLTEYTQLYPQLAEEIRDVFPALLVMEDLRFESGIDATPREGGRESQLIPDSVGDFHIIREVGRGGMGIVYEAEQVSLGRRVALKILPAQLLADTNQRRRFEREARAAARLHHTNIVPVFGVGEHNGMHYYAMQFIHGLGLDEVLVEVERMRELTSACGVGGEQRTAGQPAAKTRTTRQSGRHAILAGGVAHSLLSGRFDRTLIVDDMEDRAGSSDGNTSIATDSSVALRDPLRDTAEGRLSETHASPKEFALPGQSKGDSQHSSRTVYWQSVARIGVQAAEALQYAHDQGIVHRDVKPANLLLDTCGTVWVTDFGLAKASDQKDLTQTGDVLGTLRYMAPEQLEGKADARSDIYSLGLTLYELLAMRPAFDEQERNRLIKQVAAGTPLKLRVVDPHIPRDLETIVHKALDREPGHRYQTAGELTDDLKRYLGDEPIRARRISPVGRFGRWCRRNPALASLSSAVALLLMMVTAVSAVAYQQTAAALVQVEKNANEAAQNAALAQKKSVESEANAARAAENALRAEQNEKEAKQSAALAQENEKKALSEAEKSKQVTDFLVKLFEGPQPVAWMGIQLDAIGVGSKMTARELLDRGAKQALSDLKDRPEVQAKMLDTLGHIYTSLGYMKEAEPLLVDALKRRKELLGPDHLDVAATLEHLGWLRHFQGNQSQALQLHRDALAIRQKKLGEGHLLVSDSLLNIGLTFLLQTRWQEAGDSFRRSLALRQKLLPPSHRDVGFPMLGLALARWHGSTGTEDAISLVKQAETMFAVIGEGHNFGAVLARWMLVESGQTKDFEKDYRDLLHEARQVLGDEHPWVIKLFGDRAHAFLSRKLAGAENVARESLALTRKVYGDEHPATGVAMMRLAASLYQNQKDVSTAQWKEAEELYRKALVCLQTELKLAKAQDAVSTRRRQIIAQAGLGDATSKLDRPAEAVTWYEQALKSLEKYKEDFPAEAKDQEDIRERVRHALDEARKKVEAKK